MNVIKQTGHQDCGLFAIAYLTSVCHGEDPTEIIYLQNEMRAHLIKCFENCKLEPFPVQKKRRHEKILTKQELEIYCYCRLT